MAVIFWAEAGLSNDSQVRDIDAWSNSLQTNLRGALDDQHFFSVSTGTADRGGHRLGSGRAYVDTASNLSTSNSTRGQLYLTSDTSRLFVITTSGTTNFIGSPHVPEVIGWRTAAGSNVTTYPGTGRGHWRMQAGHGTTGSSGTTQINMPAGYISASDYAVVATPLGNPVGVSGSGLGPAVFLVVQIAGASQFLVSSISDTGGAASTVSFTWISCGTATAF